MEGNEGGGRHLGTGVWRQGGRCSSSVMHWLPLPPPPVQHNTQHAAAAKAKHQTPNGQGAGKKQKVGGPRGGWVGQSTKRGWGQIYFPDIFLSCF
jgi:hypothetical protein